MLECFEKKNAGEKEPVWLTIIDVEKFVEKFVDKYSYHNQSSITDAFIKSQYYTPLSRVFPDDFTCLYSAMQTMTRSLILFGELCGTQKPNGNKVVTIEDDGHKLSIYTSSFSCGKSTDQLHQLVDVYYDNHMVFRSPYDHFMKPEKEYPWRKMLADNIKGVIFPKTHPESLVN